MALFHDMMLIGGGKGSIQIVNTSFSTGSTSATLPAGLQPGDLVLCFGGADASPTTIDQIIPTGFTSIVSSFTSLVYFAVSYKVMSSPVDTTATVTTATDRGYAFVGVRNVNSTTPVEASTNNNVTAVDGTTQAAGNITTSFNKSGIFVYGILDDDITTATGPAGYDEVFDATVGVSLGGFTHALYFKEEPVAGTYSPGSITFGSTDSIRTATFALRNG